MAQTPRHFLRQLTPEFARAYLEIRKLPVPPSLWTLRPDQQSQRLAAHVLDCDDRAAETVLTDVARCIPFASEIGRQTLAQALAEGNGLVGAAAECANHEERTLWFLLHHPIRFSIAEEFLFADYYAEGSRGRVYRMESGRQVNMDKAARCAFEVAIGSYFRQRDGSGRSCKVEIATRTRDCSTQVTLYIQGLPQSMMQARDGDFQRETMHPTIEAAAIYEAATGRLTVISKGGKRVQDRLQQEIAHHLLGSPAGAHVAPNEHFHLDALSSRCTLAPLPQHGVEAVRVRSLRLVPLNRSGHFVVEAPKNSPETSAYDMCDRWFSQGTAALRRFEVDGVTIALHYARPPGRHRAKTINIQLSRSSTSNTKRLPPSDRQVAEAHMAAWGLIS